MEGAYLGAVRFHPGGCAADRRRAGSGGDSVQRQGGLRGRQPLDIRILSVADSLNMERFLALHTDDVRLTVANYPTAAGKDALAGAIGGLWKRIKAMSHSIVSAWSLHEDTVGIAETLCMYTRPDDSTHTIRPCTVLRRRGGLICDVRIHAEHVQPVSTANGCYSREQQTAEQGLHHPLVPAAAWVVPRRCACAGGRTNSGLRCQRSYRQRHA